MDEQVTHFGYQSISVEQKSQKVADVFHSVAKKYDVMNDLMSAGLHRIWKKFMLTQSRVRFGHKVLDIAAGTADIAQSLAKKVGISGEVWVTDINYSMLSIGRDRLLDKGLILPVVLCDAEKLPFPDQYFDCVAVAFGLRNMTHQEHALREMYRVLRIGGRLLILEFSRVWKPLQPLYDLYSFTVLPFMGKVIAHDAESYRYLAESIRMHPDQKKLTQMLQEVGFISVNYFNMLAGIVALHSGYRSK